MKRERLAQLVNKLGMEFELQPLLCSDANLETGYERFEKAIDICLRKYDDYVAGRYSLGIPIPRYVSKKTNRRTIFSRFKESVEIFRQFYGIGCEPKEKMSMIFEEIHPRYLDYDEIRILGAKTAAERARNEEEKAHYLSMVKEYDYSLNRLLDRENRNKKNCSNMADRVILMLKQKHKKDIWYLTA